MYYIRNIKRIRETFISRRALDGRTSFLSLSFSLFSGENTRESIHLRLPKGEGRREETGTSNRGVKSNGFNFCLDLPTSLLLYTQLAIYMQSSPSHICRHYNTLPNYARGWLFFFSSGRSWRRVEGRVACACSNGSPEWRRTLGFFSGMRRGGCLSERRAMAERNGGERLFRRREKARGGKLLGSLRESLS